MRVIKKKSMGIFTQQSKFSNNIFNEKWSNHRLDMSNNNNHQNK